MEGEGGRRQDMLRCGVMPTGAMTCHGMRCDLMGVMGMRSYAVAKPYTCTRLTMLKDGSEVPG